MSELEEGGHDVGGDDHDGQMVMVMVTVVMVVIVMIIEKKRRQKLNSVHIGSHSFNVNLEMK